MKNINSYIKNFDNKEEIISEFIKFDQKYIVKPKSKQELQSIIKDEIANKGNNCDLGFIDTSEIDDFSGLFRNNQDFCGTGLQYWKTSNVKDMQECFAGCSDFNCDINNWNVINVTNMKRMFLECESFNQNLNKWNVGGVKNMENMFSLCESFNGNITRWNVNSVENMYGMFISCYNFNQDLSKWNPNSCKKFANMFRNCHKFSCDLTQWDVLENASTHNMFKGTKMKKGFIPKKFYDTKYDGPDRIENLRNLF
jgi:surface protein